MAYGENRGHQPQSKAKRHGHHYRHSGVAAAASTDIEPTNTNMKVPTASARYLLIDTDTSFAGNSPIQDIDPVDAGPGLS